MDLIASERACYAQTQAHRLLLAVLLSRPLVTPTHGRQTRAMAATNLQFVVLRQLDQRQISMRHICCEQSGHNGTLILTVSII